MAYRKKLDDVWKKGKNIPGKNPDLYKEDKCGNVIYKPSFGKMSDMGWNIDHSKPQSLGGTDHLNNLQPMNSRQNSSKNNTYHYHYDSCDSLGKTRYDIIRTEIDKRSSLVKNDEILFNFDGSISRYSKALKNGDVRLNNDGSVNLNSKAVRNGTLIIKK